MREVSLSLAWIPVAAYLIGSIPFGILLAKLFGGVDVRESRQRQYRRDERGARGRAASRHPHAGARRIERRRGGVACRAVCERQRHCG